MAPGSLATAAAASGPYLKNERETLYQISEIHLIISQINNDYHPNL